MRAEQLLLELIERERTEHGVRAHVAPQARDEDLAIAEDAVGGMSGGFLDSGCEVSDRCGARSRTLGCARRPFLTAQPATDERLAQRAQVGAHDAQLAG